MKKLIYIMLLIFPLLSFSQNVEYKGYVEAYGGKEQVLLKIGGNDVNAINFGGFRYGLQFERDVDISDKMSIYGGMYWNTFSHKTKIVTEVSWGIVWNYGGAAGLRFGGNVGIQHTFGRFTVSGIGKIDEYKLTMRPMIGVGYTF